MQNLFIDLLNISITASYIIIVVILFRVIFKKIPRKFICILWGIAGLRLIMPFSFESIFSLIPSTETIPSDIATSSKPAISSGITAVNSIVNPIVEEAFTPQVSDSANPLQILTSVCSTVWIVGIIAILAYGVFSCLRLKKTVSTAVLLKDNVWQSENVFSPFILGFMKPKIFIPFGLNDETVSHVVSHENAHLRRKDHWIKPFGFLLLAVYWFNPLVWIAYVLLCRDIEAACDEKVIAQMNTEARQEYASALLNCAVNRRKIAVCPLAFGEVGVKERIKGVMSYKKPAFWIIILSVIACVAAAVCFLTSPADRPTEYKGIGYILKVEVNHYEGTTQLPAKTEKFTIEPYEKNKATISGFTEFKVAQTDLQTGKVTLEFNKEVYLGDNKTETITVDLGESETVWLQGSDTAAIFTFERTQTIEEAISAAVIEHNKNRYMKGTFACESHQTLHNIDEEEYDEKTDTRTFTFTAYMVASYSEYVCFGGEPESVSGGTGPVALTFEYDFNEGKYNLVEYWEAEDGSRYVSSIEDKFPWQAAIRAVKDDSIAKNLNADCDRQAQVYFAGATEKAFAYCDIPTVSVAFKELVTDGHMPCIEYEIFNYGDKEISYDVGYSLYKYENGSWIPLGPIVFNLWNMTDNNGIRIKPEESKIVKYGIDKSHISEDGHYRFETKIKSHTVSPAVEGTISIDFSIGDTRIHPDLSNEELTTNAVSISDLNCVSRYCYVNYVENGAPVVFENSEVPVHVGDESAELYALFETKAGFDSFCNETSDVFTYNQSHDEVPSFNDLKSMYDESFFKNNHLIIVYLPEGSGSVRHKTESVSVVDGWNLDIAISRIRPEDGTMDMSGWFALFEIPRNELKHVNVVTVRVGETEIINESTTEHKKTDGSITYTLESSSEYIKPYINLKNGRFVFFTSVYSSYLCEGEYELTNDKLTLKSNDGRYTYVFNVDGENMVFDAKNSSEPEKFKPSANAEPVPTIQDGDIFVKG